MVGKWHVYPEMAAAGLWTTPTDLAKFGIEIAKSKHGNSNLVLSESMTRQMLTAQIENAALGFFLAPDNPDRFAHGGADEGFQAMFVMLGDEGQGAVVMANSDNGIAVANHLIESDVAAMPPVVRPPISSWSWMRSTEPTVLVKLTIMPSPVSEIAVGPSAVPSAGL